MSNGNPKQLTWCGPKQIFPERFGASGQGDQVNPFAILDCRFSIQERTNEENISPSILRFSIRQSKTQNPQSKMAGAFGNRFRAGSDWGCGSGAAAEESPSDRLFVFRLWL
jgi:hypothetical protein